MDTQQPQMIKKERGGGEEVNSKPKEVQSNTMITCSSPPSPSHEFSFTISLQPSSTSPPDNTNNKSTPSFAIDLSPADEIFFHGHLLPLHLLSHLPISPRSSTNSFECSTPPIKDVLEEDQNPKNDNNNNISRSNDQYHGNNGGTKKRIKVKSFSIFRPAKWRKQCEIGDREEGKDDETTKKKKVKLDASHILKRYLRMVRPLLFFRGRSKNCQLQMKPHSFSSNISDSKGKQLQRKRTNSAPASMQTSATNSGSFTKLKLPSTMNDSSMDELQSAIEAAIAHCKSSSTTKEEKFKFQY